MESSSRCAYESQSCSWNSFIFLKLSFGIEGDLSLDFECLFWILCVRASIEEFISSSKSMVFCELLLLLTWWLLTLKLELKGCLNSSPSFMMVPPTIPLPRVSSSFLCNFSISFFFVRNSLSSLMYFVSFSASFCYTMIICSFISLRS